MCTHSFFLAGSFPVEVLSPWGLTALALLIPLVVLYILRIKRQRKRVATTWLWAAAQRDLLARHPFKKLIAQIPLLLQALVLLFLGLALARPATRGRAITGDHLAIVIDTSASMSAAATEHNVAGNVTTRLDLAKQVAKDLVSALQPGSDVLVLEAALDARLASPLDRDAVRVKAAIDRLQPRDVEGDLGAAVALAVDRLRQLGGSRRILVLTDGNLARPTTFSGTSIAVEVITVGSAADNAAIIRTDVRSGTDPVTKREQVQAFLVVANFGTKPRELFVTMREDNASDTLASRKVLVQPGERLPVVLTFFPTRGDYRRGLAFEISPHDAMPVDDMAYGRVPAGDKLPVFLAAPGDPSPWLYRAIAADPAVDLKTGSTSSLSAAGGVEVDSFVVVDGACPDNPPGADLFIVHPPAGTCFGALVGQTLENPTITSWESRDSRLRFLTLDGVYISRANLIRPQSTTQELIRTQSGPIAVDISTPARTATLLGFDVGESDWPLKASFVLFTRNLLEQARAHRAQGVTGPARAGEPLRATIPATATDVTATGPNGEKAEVSMRAGLAVVPDVTKTGFYNLAWQGPQAGTLVVPVNLTSAAESDLSAKPLTATSGDVTVTQAGSEPDSHNEWTWVLALIALAFIVFDVWYFTRAPKAVSLGSLALAPKLPERPRG
ncbi:MAG: BatA and WFA domain-containing protein [Polyangiaceae bacterium]|nr:BatA and WFA domain-containing protein [Polyangiaceae bacterium]